MERMPLSNKEYYAVRELFGIINSFEACAPLLQARCKLVPGAWRDLRMICAKARKLAESLVRTVPVQKLNSMQLDLEHTRCEVTMVRDFTGKAKEQGFSYVPDKAIERMTERLINWECACCDKNRLQGKKCPILRDVEALYPWPMPPKTEKCPLAGCFSIMKEAE